MNIRKQHDKLKANIRKEYNRLVPKFHTFKPYHKLTDLDGELLTFGLTDLRDVVSELELTDSLSELPNVYYNDKNGKEREGYILEISEKSGIVLYDVDKSKLVNIGFSDINTLSDAIEVLELLDENSKTLTE